MSNHQVPTITLSDFLEMLTKFNLTLSIDKSNILSSVGCVDDTFKNI